MSNLQELQEELAVAEAARAFLSQRRNWCRGNLFAQGWFSKPATMETADRACAMGALYKNDSGAVDAIFPYSGGVITIFPCAASRVLDRMKDNVYNVSRGRIDNRSVANLNDRFGWTLVLELYDRTIDEIKRAIPQAGLTEPSIPIQVPEPAKEPRYVPMPDPVPREEPSEPAPSRPVREPEKVPA